jgi:hypothetical protein
MKESEFIALDKYGKEAKWFLKLLWGYFKLTKILCQWFVYIAIANL